MNVNGASGVAISNPNPNVGNMVPTPGLGPEVLHSQSQSLSSGSSVQMYQDMNRKSLPGGGYVNSGHGSGQQLVNKGQLQMPKSNSNVGYSSIYMKSGNALQLPPMRRKSFFNQLFLVCGLAAGLMRWTFVVFRWWLFHWTRRTRSFLQWKWCGVLQHSRFALIRITAIQNDTSSWFAATTFSVSDRSKNPRFNKESASKYKNASCTGFLRTQWWKVDGFGFTRQWNASTREVGFCFSLIATNFSWWWTASSSVAAISEDNASATAEPVKWADHSEFG